MRSGLLNPFIGFGLVGLLLALLLALRPRPVEAIGRVRVDCVSTNWFWVTDMLAAGQGGPSSGVEVSQYRSTSILVILASGDSEQTALAAVMAAFHRMQVVAVREQAREFAFLEPPHTGSGLRRASPIYLQPLMWSSIFILAIVLGVIQRGGARLTLGRRNQVRIKGWNVRS